MIGAAYLAADGYEQPLGEELVRRGASPTWHGRLALTPETPREVAWAVDTWLAPEEVAAPSVGAAASALRAVQRNWSLYAAGQFRRAALIEARLPPVRARALRFPEAPPASHLGAWTLLAPDRLLLSPTKSSPFTRGECRFEEDREGPPSRAYLKLWEALTRLGTWPRPGERCIDLGAAPGGWTWTLGRLGANVLAVDKARLDPAIAAMPGIETVEQSAFALAPQAVDWLVCDVVAYPRRLLGLVERWMSFARHIVCTIKFQGATDHDAADAFAALPGGRVAHLWHNKHELTFTWPAG